jgi:regulatory protein
VPERSHDALRTALSALRHKERTTAELAAWLRDRCFGEAEVDAAIASLIEAGELDDRRFARRYAQDKRELGGWGPARIREALAARRVPPALVEAALEEDSDRAQLDRASELLAKRFQELTAERDRARALSFLTRRGYDYEVAYDAVRRAARSRA